MANREQMRPVRVHLDTSDYSAMYRAPPGTDHARVRDELKEWAQSGRIEIGLSYHVVFELLQKAKPQFREDRLERARLLTELCGRNAFPYPTDLGQGHGFSNEGLWMPRIDLEEVEIEHIVEHMMDEIAKHPTLNRHERRILSKRKYFGRSMTDEAGSVTRLIQEMWPLRFGRAFVEDGDLSRYLLGEMSRSDANRKLRFYISDPVTMYEVWFEQYARDDPITERRDGIVGKFTLMLEQLKSKLDEGADLQAKINAACAATGDDALSPEEHQRLVQLKKELRTFREEMTSPQELCDQVPVWKELFGDEAALVAAQILYAFHREKRPLKQSDGIDSRDISTIHRSLAR